MPIRDVNQIRDLIKNTFSSFTSQDAWVHLGDFGHKMKQLDPSFNHRNYGKEKLSVLLADYGDLVELYRDDCYDPPVTYLRLREHAKNSSSVTEMVTLPQKVGPKHIGQDKNYVQIDWKKHPLFAWAYFPGFHEAMKSLAKDYALDEPWSLEDLPDAEPTYPVLEKYFKYTFIRLKREGKIKESKEHRIAAFNTGLVDDSYEDIYSIFRPNNIGSESPWLFSSFCRKAHGTDGKDLVRVFNPLPETAHYFNSPSEMFYDIKSGFPDVNWEHVIIDNIDRYPLQFLKEHAPRGFQSLEVLPNTWEEQDLYFDSLARALRQDSSAYRRIKNRIEDAIEFALKKVRWNYKVAVPSYYPTNHTMSLLLPLALLDDSRVDLALVTEKTIAGKYLGHTILTLEMAYNNARLVCRPDSFWLAPEMAKGF